MTISPVPVCAATEARRSTKGAAISPYAQQNYVDHGVTDQSSILRFIEDNWSLGRIGNDSTDAIAGSLLPMFNFEGKQEDKVQRLILYPASGTPVGGDQDDK